MFHEQLQRVRHMFGRRSKSENPHLFPPLPEIVLPGWAIVRQDRFLKLKEGEERFVTRFSLQEGQRERGYINLTPLANSPAQFVAWIRVDSPLTRYSLGTQLLHMAQDYLIEKGAVGLARESQAQDVKSIFEKNGWEEVVGLPKWRSYNKGTHSDEALRKLVDDGALYDVEYKRALRREGLTELGY